MNALLSTARKSPSISLLIALQTFCVLILSWDAALDLLGVPSTTSIIDNDTLEIFVVIALIGGLAASIVQFKRLMDRNEAVEDQLKAASGAFMELMNKHFDHWDLTHSERDVALLAIKGLEIADIAGVRNTKSGTIKAQLNAIYRKASVSGRPQLISLFIEELMGDQLTATA